MAKVSKRLRFEILRRDQFRCRYCGKTAGEIELRVDHVVPEALGGTSEPSNLAASCEPCNNGKSSTPPDAPIVDQVADGALQWSAAMQAAARMKEREIEARDKLSDEFQSMWSCYQTSNGAEIPLPDDWDVTVHRFRAAGLTDALIDEAVAAAMKAYKVPPDSKFRYFCGVAWNMLTELQGMAQQSLAEPPSRTPDLPTDTDANWFEYLGSRERYDLEGDLWIYRYWVERALLCLPEELRKQAEEEALDGYRKNSLPLPSEWEMPPLILAFAAFSMRRISFDPAPAGGAA